MDELTILGTGWLVILWLGALLITLSVWIWASRKKSLGLIEDAKTHIYRSRQAAINKHKKEDKDGLSYEN